MTEQEEFEEALRTGDDDLLEGSLARLEQLGDDLSVLTQEAMYGDSKEDWDAYGAAHDAWVAQYILVYGDEPDWGAIRDGCA